ncbi:hypothetical protein [Deinococcus humi]|uniref:Carboxypeptidase regulatory-like domain-containing protein n=1 Tax=Deinococcus humi TaxID=662880 RepID=A0A7W8NEC9_9DEIO|nr:hypothetical protein [Deinococcus humi]MBB5362550.1 hypothetical protein [Deinococcus humi]GGO28249.1 hypothetical protein GCM10008949_20720 [Deinococcus humi]
MNLRLLLSLALGLSVPQASALTVTGTVQGSAAPDLRLAGFAVTPFGQPVQELASSSLDSGQFRLDLPAGPPPARAQAVLSSQNVSWPGVIDPVQVSAAAQTGELKLFVYRDQNGNARHDENESLREVSPMVGRSSLFIPWVSADVTVTANKGYQASLKKGWNAFLVDVGRVVNVQPFAEAVTVTVSLQR